MKILYDFQIFEYQKFGGISRLFYELMVHLENEITYELPIKYSKNAYLKDLAAEIPTLPIPNPLEEFAWKKNFKGKKRVFDIYSKYFPPEDYSQVNLNLSKEKLNKGDYDIFHPTYYVDYFSESIQKPYVLTVFDMIHEIYPEHFFYDNTTVRKLRLAQKATKIIAISESTRQDLIRFFDIPASKIEVIYLGNSLDKASPEKGKLLTPEKYILFVGNREVYKNFYFFLQSIQSILQRSKDLHLICTGSPFNGYEINFFRDLGLENQIHHHFVNDDQLSFLYTNALMFAFPSMYEGFGIPVLEAFSCKCPTLLSNTSSLLEVGGEAVVYIDPKDPESIRKGTNMLLENSSLRSELKEKGTEQLKKFSWTKMAEETLDLYNTML